MDIFGNHPQQNDSPKFECVNCKRPFPSKRYAPHLEKCLGLAGRSSSRVANLKYEIEYFISYKLFIISEMIYRFHNHIKKLG